MVFYLIWIISNEKSQYSVHFSVQMTTKYKKIRPHQCSGTNWWQLYKWQRWIKAESPYTLWVLWFPSRLILFWPDQIWCLTALFTPCVLKTSQRWEAPPINLNVQISIALHWNGIKITILKMQTQIYQCYKSLSISGIVWNIKILPGENMEDHHTSGFQHFPS